jgi:hypothetical protein
MEKLQYDWVRLGAVAGILGVVSYFMTQIPVVPEGLARIMAFSFGVWLVVLAVGMSVFLGLERKTIFSQLGALFFGIAGVTVNFMLVVQQSIRSIMGGYWAETTDPVAQESLRWVWRGLNSVHLGLDISFDIFLMLGVVLLGVAMWGHPRFGKLYAVPGILVAGAALLINLYTFPVPPGSEPGTFVDLGPLIGLWGLFVGIRMLGSLKWAKEKLEVGSRAVAA